MSDGAAEAYATVCERAVRLLWLLRPWAANGPEDTVRFVAQLGPAAS